MIFEISCWNFEKKKNLSIFTSLKHLFLGIFDLGLKHPKIAKIVKKKRPKSSNN